MILLPLLLFRLNVFREEMWAHDLLKNLAAFEFFNRSMQSRWKTNNFPIFDFFLAKGEKIVIHGGHDIVFANISDAGKAAGKDSGQGQIWVRAWVDVPKFRPGRKATDGWNPNQGTAIGVAPASIDWGFISTD